MTANLTSSITIKSVKNGVLVCLAPKSKGVSSSKLQHNIIHKYGEKNVWDGCLFE